MTLTAFFQHQVVAQGTPEEIAPKLRPLHPLERASDLLVFDDDTGKQVDIDVRVEVTRSRGRPALGVQAREVTLLPRHWDWLSQQRGGASATLRQLVEAALREGRSQRDNQDAAYRFLSVMAGDLPHFDDAIRELYRGNKVGYDHFTHGWSPAIRDHGRKLAWPD
jgi:hypothetical protein